MKAQVTIEYLLLSVIALVLISFSLISLVHIKESSEKAYGATLFKSSATELSNAIQEVCALGKGNVRVVYVKRSMDVEGKGADPFYAEFTDAESGISIAKETFCEVDGTEVHGKTKVKNEDGEIILESA